MAALQRQRHGEEPGRLVQHDDRFVLVDDRKVAIGAERRATLGAARPIHPQPDDVAGGHSRRGVGQGHLAIVDEHLAAFERGGRPRTRPGPIGGGQILVEAEPHLFAPHRPLRHTA